MNPLAILSVVLVALLVGAGGGWYVRGDHEAAKQLHARQETARQQALQAEKDKEIADAYERERARAMGALLAAARDNQRVRILPTPAVGAPAAGQPDAAAGEPGLSAADARRLEATLDSIRRESIQHAARADACVLTLSALQSWVHEGMPAGRPDR